MIKVKGKSQRGFTLLELLVVIGIIGILMGVGSISFSTAQKRARDARRRQDVEAISKALEQYYADNDSSYPLDTSCVGIETYFASGMPTDPKTGSYNFDNACALNGTAFCVCAELETVGTGNAYQGSDGGRTGSSCNFSGGGTSKDYFCAQSVQ